MKRIFLSIAMCVMAVVLKAQMGYQVALLNSATGEPRANVTVTAAVSITDSEGATVYTETQTATTNDFGILSLSVGHADTFKEADWNKLPFFISVSVDGVLVGKSQILSVPVAEYAKVAGNVLTKEMLVGTWEYKSEWSTGSSLCSFHFNMDGTGREIVVKKWYGNESTPPNESTWVYDFRYEILPTGMISLMRYAESAFYAYLLWYSFSEKGLLVQGDEYILRKTSNN